MFCAGDVYTIGQRVRILIPPNHYKKTGGSFLIKCCWQAEVTVEQEAWQVLIVEDDQRLAELTRDYLEANGLRVSIEGNGALAAARIIKEKPDLVILDLMLPGEDGLSICRKVRDKYDGPILMLTARTDDTDQILGLDPVSYTHLTLPTN